MTRLVYRLARTLAIARLLFLPYRPDPWRDFRRHDAQRGHNGCIYLKRRYDCIF
jgi:hypothetical protein